jgi:hypothetical protein
MTRTLFHRKGAEDAEKPEMLTTEVTENKNMRTPRTARNLA